jgi:tetratricopeptide (TPR) repeat protein
MTPGASSEIQNLQLRLARHYLTKLRTASMAIHRGQASVNYGLDLFDQEWEQIEHWQSHACERSGIDSDWTRLCKEFPLAGLEVLSRRQNLPDQASWLESGLEAALQQGDDRAELAILSKLCRVYGLLGVVKKSAFYADKLLTRGSEIHDRLAIGRGYYGLGSVAEDRGLYAEAQMQVQWALDIFSELGARTDEGLALFLLGSISLYMGETEVAFDYFSKHLELVESEGIMSEVCRGLLSVAQTLLMLEAYDQAEAYILRAVRLSRMLGFQRLLGAGLIMLAQWHGEQGRIELEIKYYTEGINAARTSGSQRDLIHGLSNLGLAKLLNGELEGALSSLQEGLELARQAGIPRFICNLQRNITDTYLALKDPESARIALKEALAMARELGSSYQTLKVLTSVIGYWHLMGWNEPAARWAGCIMYRPEVDLNLFEPICIRLQTAIGQDNYREALEEGRMLNLDEILDEVEAELAPASS